MPPLRTVLLALVLVALAAPASGQATLDVAFPNLSFVRPVAIEHAPGEPGRLYVVEQPGRIRTFVRSPLTNQAPVFLDITGPVDSSGNEMGLLGLAFHPDFAENGYFYVNYTVGNPRRTRISRFTATSATAADPASELVLLEFGQPYSNHNGGDLTFGPDGYLYIASGDGGSGGDPQNFAQNRQSLLGKILRLDVDGGGTPPDCGGSTANYTIPANALAGATACDEVYAYGLRNPWRFSFDAVTGDFWVADVGQNAWEEINLVENGDNMGWKVKEGFACYSNVPGNPPCNDPSLVDPIFVYGHGQGDRSITGGFVYRGANVPELAGRYVYGDFVSGRVWALTYTGSGTPANAQIFQITALSTFGVDEEGELYVASFDGRIRKFGSLSTGAEADAASGPARFWLAGPNPARGGTAVAFSLAQPGAARVALYDVLGRRVAVPYEAAVAAGEVVHVPLTADALPAGVYVARLEVDGTPARALRLTLAR